MRVLGVFLVSFLVAIPFAQSAKSRLPSIYCESLALGAPLYTIHRRSIDNFGLIYLEVHPKDFPKGLNFFLNPRKRIKHARLHASIHRNLLTPEKSLQLVTSKTETGRQKPIATLSWEREGSLLTDVDIGIDKTYQAQHLGTLLFSKMLEIERGIEVIEASLTVDNLTTYSEALRKTLDANGWKPGYEINESQFYQQLFDEYGPFLEGLPPTAIFDAIISTPFYKSLSRFGFKTVTSIIVEPQKVSITLAR